MFGPKFDELTIRLPVIGFFRSTKKCEPAHNKTKVPLHISQFATPTLCVDYSYA